MTGRSLPQWNAYVESGRTIQERRERLREVPEEWRDAVAAHVAMVWQMKHAARQRRRSGGSYG